MLFLMINNELCWIRLSTIFGFSKKYKRGSRQRSANIGASVDLKTLLVFEVLHQTLHVPQLSVQLGSVVVDHVHLSAQVGHVRLKHGLDVGPTRALVVQQLPLGLKHLILLLQEAHL